MNMTATEIILRKEEAEEHYKKRLNKLFIESYSPTIKAIMESSTFQKLLIKMKAINSIKQQPFF